MCGQSRHLIRAARWADSFPLLVLLLTFSGCAVRRTQHISPSQLPGPARTASVTDLVQNVDDWGRKIHTLTAIVSFQPSAGSVYSGVIKEYHDVRGFVLLKAPSLIRIQGQAPVVRTEIFDMVSDGDEFRLSIPPQNKFIIGKTSYHGTVNNSLENLRPQHILDALLIPPLDTTKDKYFVEQSEAGPRLYYILTVVEPGQKSEMKLQRKIWFDRSDLKLARLELYAPDGSLREEVQYSAYQDFQGVSYPAKIKLSCPAEGYSLGIAIEKATFNQELPPEKFKLPEPPNATVIQLGGEKTTEAPRGR